MRIEQLRLPAVKIALLASLCWISGCPGELKNKAAFEAYAAEHGDAGAPSTQNEAGSSGSAGTAGSDGRAGTAGSAGTDGSAGSDGASACGDVVTRIFVPSCGGTGCHSAKAPQEDLDLVSADVTSRVVGVSAKQCVGVLADPQNPEESVLYKKLFPQPDCGTAQMPLARPPLSSADVACVLGWIAAQ
jgi:hypothetical protein